MSEGYDLIHGGVRRQCEVEGCTRTQEGHKVHSTPLNLSKTTATQRRINRAVNNTLLKLANDFERDGMLTAATRTREMMREHT